DEPAPVRHPVSDGAAEALRSGGPRRRRVAQGAPPGGVRDPHPSSSRRPAAGALPLPRGAL
ncbi:MAG: hypothetical protein AVDCRST_MAG02-1855, partial [uncultured Rubrobacteraceae bacterium]